MSPLRIALAASCVLAASSLPARAGSSGGELTVSATVVNSCVVSGGTLEFGAYDAAYGADLEGSGAVSVACTAGATATIVLDQGANPDAGSSDQAPRRRLSDGGHGFLSYTLYSDAAHATEWGNTADTGKAYTAESAAPAAQTVYGRVAANQQAPLGAYTDHLVVTVLF